MNLPDTTRIVDTYVPILSSDISEYYEQLRRDILIPIRNLQKENKLLWYAFLLHGAQHLDGRETDRSKRYIHLKIEPSKDLSPSAFIEGLPSHFLKPIEKDIGAISDFDNSIFSNGDSAYAWKLHGEASECILSLIEGHQTPPPIQHIIQFLHYLTNPLAIGHKCLFMPAGYFTF